MVREAQVSSEGNTAAVGELVVSALMHDWASNCVDYMAGALRFYSDLAMVMNSDVMMSLN